MTRRRVYVPLTADGLTGLATSRQAGPAPVHGFSAPGGASEQAAEQVEHEAWLAAAGAARSLVSVGARRVIGSADVDSALIEELAVIQPGSLGRPPVPAGPVRVVVGAPIPLRHFVSFHVDEEPEGVDEDLLWYDVTELSEVLALLIS